MNTNIMNEYIFLSDYNLDNVHMDKFCSFFFVKVICMRENKLCISLTTNLNEQANHIGLIIIILTNQVQKI